MRPGLLLIALALALATASLLLPPLAQPLTYHAFADRRAFLGIPNLLDVTSNLAFLVVGLLGLRLLIRRGGPDAVRFIDARERLPYMALFLAVMLTCFGSIYYHLEPDNLRLTWDRLPMAAGFSAFLAAMIAERITVRTGVRLLLPFLVAGMGTVWYWRWSAAQGAENLWPYLAVQGYSFLAALLLIGLFPPRYTHGRLIVLALCLYAMALVGENLDHQIYSVGQLVSGHTVKHLLGATAIYQLYRMLRDRSPVAG